MNTLLKINLETIRVLWVEDEQIIVTNIYDNHFPFAINKDNIKSGIEQGLIIVLESDPFITFDKKKNSDSHIVKRDSIWDKLQQLLEAEPEIYDKVYRRESIRKYSKESGYSERKITEYMKRYWKRGKIKDAFLPDYFRCGAPGVARSDGMTKRGRPNKNKEIRGEGLNINETWKKKFVVAINKYYYSTAKNSLQMTFELLKRDYMKETPTTLKDTSDFPTFNQFRYWFMKDRNVKKEISSRYSNKKFQKENRPLLGNIIQDVNAPGVFEIDAHIGDFYLTSGYNKNWIIGRPILYVVIDKFSRSVVGIFVGLENGSYTGSMMGLYNSSRNKVDFCKEYEIQILQEEWPMANIPTTIIADRGELEGSNIENLTNLLGVTVMNTQPYRADYKASVERFFGILNSNIKSLLPGKIDLDGRERGDKDYRLDAKLTLFEYTKIVIYSVLYYNKTLIGTYERDVDMIADGLIATPLNLWNWGIRNRGNLVKYPSQEVMIALMPTTHGVLTRNGIKFKNMFYVSKTMLQNGDFERGGMKTKKLKLWFDPRDLTFIIISTDNGEYERCMILQKSERYLDKSMEEILQLLEKENELKEEFRSESSNDRVKLIERIESVVKPSIIESEKLINTLSNRKKTENIRENRRVERVINRSKEAFSDIEFESDVTDDVLQMIIKQQNEGMDDD